MMQRDAQPTLLVLRALKLGDLLVAVPALKGLRKAFPKHRMVLATSGWLAPIVDLVGGIDELVPQQGLSHPIALPPGSVEVAVNLHGSGPESDDLVTALRPQRLIGHAPLVPEGPAWTDGMLERERWARLVTAFGIPASADDVGIEPPAEPPVVAGAAVVHVGAFYGSRAWPVERFAAVATWLRGRGATVVFTGDERERPRAEAVARLAGFDEASVLAGRMSLAGFAAVIAAARLVVSADTGAAHLASAYGIPSVIIFGPAPAEEWGPPPGPHLVLGDPSVRRGDVFSAEPDPALLAVGADDVIAAIERLGVLSG